MRAKGFIMIELIIALFVFAILLSGVFSATTFCMRTLSSIDKDVELQQQAQFVFDFMEEKIIESTGVILLEDTKGYQKHNTNEKVALRKIIFKNLPARKDKGYIIALSKDPKYDYFNLKYGVGVLGGASDEMGNYINCMEVEPIPQDKKYTEAQGIVLRIIFEFDGHAFTCENSFLYRNSPGGMRP